MYRKPKGLDPRITDEIYEKLMDIVSEEVECFMSFGGPYDHMERAVLSAAKLVLGPPCTVPPPGWYCTRTAEHEGPCAALPI